MRRSRGWLGGGAVVLALALALAWPGASAAHAATGSGPGTFSLLSADSVVAGAATTVLFSYTFPQRFGAQVTVTVTLPSGWTATAPATVSCKGGAADCWVDSQSGAQIVVGMNLGEAQAFTLEYPATPPGSAGPASFKASEEFGSSTLMYPLSTLTVTVTCPDGSGTLAVGPGPITAGQSTDLTFTYTSGSCGVGAGGKVAVIVPGGWSPPTPGSVTWSGSSPPVVSGRMIMVPVGSVRPDASVVFYCDMARAPTSPGGYTFDASEESSAIGSLQALATSPEVMVIAAVAATSPSVTATSSPASPSSGPTSSASASASSGPTSSPSASASSGVVVPSVSASGGTSLPASSGGLPVALVGLGGSGLVVALGAAGLLASRLLRRGGHASAAGNIRAVPRTGPPPSVTVRYAGNRPALTVRIEPRASAIVSTIKEIRP
jgi:hypothetical protein